MSKRVGDIISGVASVIFGIFIIWGANRLPTEAAIFPEIIGGALILIGIVLSVKSIKLPRDNTSILRNIAYSKIITTFILWVICIIFLEILGFYTSIFCFTAILCVVLMGRFSLRSFIISITFSGLTVLVYWAVFYNIVELELPNGFFI